MAALATGLGLLTACPPTYPKCESDEHCKEHGEVCVQGQCVECATDENCKSGFVCEGNKCVPKPECVSDADCGTGKACRNGKCVSTQVEAPKPECTTAADCPSGQECQEGQCVEPAACDYAPVRFGFNEHSLTAEARARLDALAECVKKQKVRLTIEGHADERGTEEYNLQLSNRRAASVKRYLTDLGVSASALETVGYGEERPAVGASTEEAWAANRRVEFTKR
ncbi:MAG: OmpA family protein [Myxococcota bacterium]